MLRHARNWVRCTQYWTNSGVDNLREMLLFVAKEYADLDAEAHPPVVYPDDGFYHLATRRFFSELPTYLDAHPLDAQLPTVLVILYGGTTLDACVAGSRELLETLSSRANVLPFFADGISTAQALERHLFDGDQPRVSLDAIVSLQWFPLEGGPLGGKPEFTQELLQRLGAPFYTPVTSYNRTLSAWRANPQGISPVETLASVTLPEMDGAIDPVYLFGLKDLEDTAPAGAATQPAPGRGRHLAERVLRRIQLRQTPNEEKKIALVLFNYPPGESTLGEASFLDVFASVEAILKRMQAKGYRVTLPDKPIKELLLGRGLVHMAQWAGSQATKQHALRIPLRRYRRWYQRLPESLRQQTEQVFGPPPGNLMTAGSDILLAGLELGNVLVAIQPSRGVHEDPAKAYHDKALPVHHQYIAFYRYLEEEFDADAVVHVGTHGTLEFTPGKELALSGQDAPDALLGAVPHCYLYHVVNASEAMIAKRRSYAQMVTYASSGFAPAELYGPYLEVQDLLAEYEAQVKVNPGRVDLILDELATKAEAVGLDTSVLSNRDDPEALEGALNQLHAELAAMKRSVIPLGLHVFGTNLDQDALIDYLALITRYDRAEAPALPRTLAQTYGLDYDALLAREDDRLDELYDSARTLIAAWLRGEQVDEDYLPAETRRFLAEIAQRVQTSDEIGALMQALNGEYLKPNLAGDPVRTPQTYPTGRNAYQFDPTRIPTATALKRGRQIAEETLQRHLQRHGNYPGAVGVVLWGFETCKTYGETIGQILAYLGVELDQGEGYYIKPVPLPLEEIGRPRVDVVVNICGFFRDLFPNQVRMLDLAFRMVADLEESGDENFVRAHTNAILEQGGSAAQAGGRLFGPPPGEYGNRLSTMIETGAWQDEAELANMFIERSKYLYGDNVHGVAASQAFNANLAHVDLVTQVRDSHEYEVSDVDHYYEFFGGLKQAAQLAQGGEGPDVFIADTTREHIKVHSAADAVRQGVTTRLLNPQWIDAMLSHDFHGGQNIADRVEYLIGLEATTQSVGQKTWQRVAHRYILDEIMRKRLLENNPYATAEIAEKLGEAQQRGYWEATPEEQATLRDAYLQNETWIEEK